MKRRRIARKGRAEIIYGLVAEMDTGGVGVTMTQIARAMGLKPSSYIMGLLWDLHNSGDVFYRISELRNGCIVRMWRVTKPGGNRHEEVAPPF